MLNIFSRRTAENDRFNGISLGDQIADTHTGFDGVCTGQCSYLTGCDQILMQPTELNAGAFVEARWFDVERIRVVSKAAVTVSPRLGGADILPPNREASAHQAGQSRGSRS